jgi:acetylornithine deacetylase/succinyl-diaminopimelate desuccinylase-like protein
MPHDEDDQMIDRRSFLRTTIAGAAGLAVTSPAHAGQTAAADRDAVIAQIATRHDATVKMLRDWIALPSIAAENVGYPEGAEYMARLARDAGLEGVSIIPTKGKPGVFARLDAGADTTLGVYFMYDVKQFDPAEWSSPPLEARLVDRPGVGKVIVGRGATNTKGPQMAFLAALQAFRAAGRRLPVNIVLVCEGEEEIGSPNFSEIVFKPEVEAALKRCAGVIIPLGSQNLNGGVEINLGAKGIVELELVSSGSTWGRGPAADVHSSLAAHIDSPVWHLVQALHTLVKPDGHTPAVEGFFDRVRPLSPELQKILEEAIPRRSGRAMGCVAASPRHATDDQY